MPLLKRYKIRKINDKYYVLINTCLFKWEHLSWVDCDEHYHGEYCEFDTYENAEEFAGSWCKHKPLTKWFKKGGQPR